MTVTLPLKRVLTRTGSRLSVLVQRTTTETERLAQAAVEGRISPRAFGDRMAALLEDAHTEAVLLGRMHAGDLSPAERDDAEFAARVVDAEAEFLAGFVEDLSDGRYAEKADAAASRASLYASRVAGTANEAFVLASEDTLWVWELGAPETGHCEECPRLAANSPYTTAELPATPRSNQTPCMQNCSCRLIRADGVEGFGA